MKIRKEYTTESNLIELVDELPEEHGQAQGPIEEITENNHHISHSGLGTENGHGNYGVIEEIEENSHVDIKSELGYEGGQNSGNQSFEEDTEEDKPKYEQGGNIVDIDFDSVPQIKVKIMVTSHSKKIQRKTNLIMNKVVTSLISTSTVCHKFMDSISIMKLLKKIQTKINLIINSVDTTVLILKKIHFQK